jgi:hypothetical protein
MNVQTDHLHGATEELRKATAENSTPGGRDWGERLRLALVGIERGLWESIGESLNDDDPSSTQDQPLLPSPGVERKEEGLRNETRDLIRQVRMLRAELASGQGNPTGAGAGAFAERIRQLVRDLKRHDRGEIDLLQESITPDIGAGD